jgi:decaprenylphospho-beta-D-ribofuranose 2-oxidase
MLASGDIVRCTPTENSELFWATAGGMGLTGILLTVTIRMQRIESAYISVDFRKTRNLAETMDLCESEDDRYHYAVCWIDCLASGKSIGRSVLMHGEHARRDQVPAKFAKDPLRLHKKTALTIPMDFPGWAINPLSVKLFNFGYYHKHPQNKMGVITDYDTYFYPLDRVQNWNRLYGRRGFIQYQFCLPEENSFDGIRQIMHAIRKSPDTPFLTVLKRHGDRPAEAAYSFPIRGYSLALDFPRTRSISRLIPQLDELVWNAGGKIYLTKDACSAARMGRVDPAEFGEEKFYSLLKGRLMEKR